MLLAVGQTLVWAGLYYVFPALLLRWEAELGFAKTSLTAAIALAVLVSAAASPLAGRLIDRGLGPHMMAASAIFGALCISALALVTAYWQFLGLWSLIGVAMAGCLYDPCFSLVTRARGANAKPAIIGITLVAGFASTIAFPAAFSAAEAFGWRATVVIFALVVAGVAAPIMWIGGRELERTRTAPEAPHDRPRETSRGFLRAPAFWLLAIGFACVAMVHGAALHHFLPILDERGLAADLAVLAASFIGPMQVAGRLAMMASDRFASHKTISLVAFASMAASTVMLMVAGQSPAFVSLFVLLFGGAWGTISILRPVLTREILGDEDFGAKSGAMALPFLVGSASAPYLGSVIWAAAGYGTMLVALTCLAAIGAWLTHLAHRTAAGH